MNNYNAKVTTWPEAGMDASDLLKMQYHVMIDAELMKSKGFQAFYSVWVMGNPHTTDHIFMQSLEAENTQIPANLGLVTVLIYKDFDDYGPAMKRIGGSWLYITNNAEKAEKIRQSAKNIRVFMRIYGLDDNGQLKNYKPQMDPRQNRNRTYNNVKNRNISPNNSPSFGNETKSMLHNAESRKEAFLLPKNIYPIQKTVYKSSTIPSKTDYVYDSSNRMIRLENEFISNSQSITYQTNLPGMQAKIYQKAWLQNSYFKDKTEKMLSIPIVYDGICWPTDILHDNNGDFVGILVPKAEGIQLKQNLMSQAGLEAHFPEWNRKDLTHLVRVILEKIVFLQERNVILGLINPGAIFVKDADHVYFAEMDTYQIEGYPILSYERVMQAPELQNAENTLQLYTKQQDNYGIALLTFMLLMPGKFPYNKGNNKDICDSIKKMTFAFRYGERQGDEHGAREYFGLWRFVWSHLGNDLKKAFYFTFQNGQPYSLSDKRKYADFWLVKVRELEKELSNPYDAESLKLFPRTFKRYSGIQTIRCVKCGIDHPAFYYKYPERRICNSCLGQPSDVHFVCKSCEKTYYYDFSTLFKYEKLVATKDFKMPTHCPYCRSDKERCKGNCGKMVPSYRLDKNGLCPDCAKEARERVVRRCRCKDCGQWFELTQGQLDSFARKSMQLPVRCETCRRNKRIRY